MLTALHPPHTSAGSARHVDRIGRTAWRRVGRDGVRRVRVMRSIERIDTSSDASPTVLSAAVHRIDRDRLLGVRDRIDRKVMEQIHPKDLFYQILDGIRSLTLYDHSSALLIREEDEASLRVVAEQIAWTKAKSERIGLRIPITR